MIESRKNRLVKNIRRLKRRKGDHLLLEGPHLIGEALDTGLELEWILATPAFLADADRRLLAALPIPPIEISPDLLGELADADSPRGILAVGRLPRSGCQSLPVRGDGVYVYLAGLQDPGNLGAVARAAEATGVCGLSLSPGCAHPNHPRALRSSAGSLLRLPVSIDVRPEALDRHLEDIRPPWVALAPAGGETLWTDTLAPPIILVVGAERGLDPEVAQRCDCSLTIPMAEPVESLNSAVATAIVLFELKRRGAG